MSEGKGRDLQQRIKEASVFELVNQVIWESFMSGTAHTGWTDRARDSLCLNIQESVKWALEKKKIAQLQSENERLKEEAESADKHFHELDRDYRELVDAIEEKIQLLKERCGKLRGALREVGGAISFTIGNRYLQPHIYSTVTMIIDKALADDGGGE